MSPPVTWLLGDLAEGLRVAMRALLGAQLLMLLGTLGIAVALTTVIAIVRDATPRSRRSRTLAHAASTSRGAPGSPRPPLS